MSCVAQFALSPLPINYIADENKRCQGSKLLVPTKAVGSRMGGLALSPFHHGAATTAPGTRNGTSRRSPHHHANRLVRQRACRSFNGLPFSLLRELFWYNGDRDGSRLAARAELTVAIRVNNVLRLDERQRGSRCQHNHNRHLAANCCEAPRGRQGKRHRQSLAGVVAPYAQHRQGRRQDS